MTLFFFPSKRAIENSIDNGHFENTLYFNEKGDDSEKEKKVKRTRKRTIISKNKFEKMTIQKLKINYE